MLLFVIVITEYLLPLDLQKLTIFHTSKRRRCTVPTDGFNCLSHPYGKQSRIRTQAANQLMTEKSRIAAMLTGMVAAKGADLYGGEVVTQEQHALQAAFLAEKDGQAAPVIVATLLHDVGHLLEPEFERAMELDKDGRHEDIGHAFLNRWFGPEVTEPVRLHVAAKRYLCATRNGYFETLSPASVHSLSLQGGPMSPDEITAFEQHTHYKAAVQVRIYDDLAKDADLKTPPLAHFMRYVETVAA